MAKILVVDDHAFNRDLIVTLAHHVGHDTVEAGDGVEALEAAMRERPDLIVCDILMPTMDGYEFVRRLRGLPEVGQTEVMFYTANYREPEARKLATSLGVSHILVKPCEPREVLDRIELALAGRPTPTRPIDNEAVGMEHRRLLTQKLAEKVAELRRANERLAVLTELNLQLTSARDCAAFLGRVCRGARELVGARYAIACLQGRNNGGEIHVQGAGLSPDDSFPLAQPSLDAGIFGDVMAHKKPRRFVNPGGDANAIGLPPGYPPAHAGVVVPVHSASTVYGWLCMCDKVGASEFSAEDEWLSSAHAAQVGRIYENSNLVEQLRHRALELRSEVDTRQRAEAQLARVARARNVLAECSRVLVRAGGESALLADMCRTIVAAAGDYGAAWIGVAHDDADKTIETVAVEGDRDGYFKNGRLSWGDNPAGRGPIGAAVRTGEPQTERFVEPGADGPSWALAMARIGQRAIAALPLICEGETLGALAIVASEAAAFDADEMELLRELADDIAYGIHTLRVRASRLQAKIGLDQSERRFQATFEQSAVGIAHLALDGRFQRVNDRLCALLGMDREALLQRGLADVTDPDDADSTRSLLAQLQDADGDPGPITREQRLRCGDGGCFWAQSTAATARPEPGEDRYVILVLQDISDRKNYEAELRHQATHDALTGLANRFLLPDRMDQAILYAQRSGESIAVMLLDLDRFKRINDGIGHASGDALLQRVAQRLNETVRRMDTVARLGGDEFMLIMPGVKTEDDASGLARNLLEAIARPVDVGGQTTVVTASVGIALYPRDGADPGSLFKNADVAMYRAKEMGRNSFSFYAPDMNARVLERLDMEAGMREALERGRFELHYQPKVAIRGGAVVGAEALVRWRRADGSMVPPAQFIPLAEEIGLIGAIGNWVMASACSQLRAWRDLGLTELSVAVNVSARQFQQEDIVVLVSETLRATGVPARCLVLELTESTVMRDPEQARQTLQALREIGVGVSLDDFGTGYSSLSYLKRFPIDSLKIDQSFVRDIPDDPEGAAIAVLVISLAHALGQCVIAEGVETETQLEFLREQGCDEIQGYHFSRPLPADAFTALLQRQGARLASC